MPGPFWRRLVWGLRSPFRRAQLDRELDDELREFVRLAADHHAAAGMAPDEALRAARAHIGSHAAVKERVWEVGWESLVESVLQDVRYGIRVLARNPGFTAVAAFALALGIGVNTAVFTAYKAMVARPLDARAPAELANFALSPQSRSQPPRFVFSYPDYQAYRDAVHAFSGLIAFSPDRMTLSDAGGTVSQRAAAAASQAGRLGVISAGVSNAEFASTYAVSENYFAVLGVAPLRGRTFDAMTSGELAASPVLVSENYWQNRFAGDPAIVGRTIHLNGAAVTIAGVTPHDFHGTGVAAPDFWLPLSLEPLVHPDLRVLGDREDERWRLFGRLAPGATLAQAQAEMAGVANHLRSLHDPHAASAKEATALVWPGSPFPLPLNQYPGLILTIVLIMSAAAMVLVVACANVGSLQLARARLREHELHTRLSLGASRGRLIRQLLTESALLALVAGSLALMLTWGLLKVLVTLAAQALPVEYGTLVFDVTPDLGIFAFVLATSLVAGLLFGLAPAMESARTPITSTARASTTSARSRRMQNSLVAAQVALSLALLIAGSLFIRSAVRSLTTDPGYDSARTVDVEIRFPEGAKYTTGRKEALVRELRARLEALPGAAAITSALPPDDPRFRTAAGSIDGGSVHQQSIVPYTNVESGYFQTLGIPQLLGRPFEPHAGGDHAVILSESAARAFWPGENPIGRMLRLGATDEKPLTTSEVRADGPAYQVAGVVRDTRGVQFDGSDSRRIYVPMSDDQVSSHPILIRTASDPAELMRAIDPAVASIDPAVLVSTSTLADRLRQSPPFAVSSMFAIVALAVGFVGLLLATMGIHGTVSYIVSQRTREVGIRMAIGAQKRDILWLILRESTKPVVAGLGVGLLLATGASYILRGVLFRLRTVDAVSFLSASCLFLVIALIAAYVPSRRAMAVDPAVSLRYE